MSALLMQARLDTRLSYRAKGLLDSLVHMHGGAVPSSRELSAHSAEGRDAIRTALDELLTCGYLLCLRYRTVSGQWHTTRVLAPMVADFQASATRRTTEDWESANVADSQALSHLSTDNVNDNSDQIDLSPNGDRSIKPPLTGRLVAKETEVGYSFFPPTSTEGEPEGVGLRVESAEEKQQRRNAKHKSSSDATTIKVRIRTDGRDEKDPSRWTFMDMVAEFAHLVEEQAPGIGGQVSAEGLRNRFSAFRKAGVANATLVHAIREFFADPARVAAAGRGLPLWKQFVAWFPTEQVRLEIAAGTRTDTFDEALAEMADEAAKRPRRF